MQSAVLEACRDADALLMAAAVADFKPLHAADNKIKKGSGVPEIKLEPTPDILSSVSRSGNSPLLVGFAAETQDLLTNASAKLNSKGLDLLVANDVSQPGSGFGTDTNQVTLLHAGGRQEPLPQMTKYEVAQRVISEVAKLLDK
jgi:phosphopantothenoylcysteine decarboxylase/phosphopantothenate--cysteine ligase